MKTLTLRNATGESIATVLVDDADYETVSRFSWRLGGSGYVVRKSGKTTQSLHRQIMGLTVGDGLVVDHINGDPFDNRRANLRTGTQAQNLQNQTPRVGGTSVHRGVCWDERHGMWKVECSKGRKRHFVGRFAIEQEAADAAASWRAEHMEWATA